MGWGSIKKLFGRGVLANRKQRRSQNKIHWRKSLVLEPLEDRTAPAADLLATLTDPPQPNYSASETAVVSISPLQLNETALLNGTADALVRQLVIVDAAT